MVVVAFIARQTPRVVPTQSLSSTAFSVEATRESRAS